MGYAEYLEQLLQPLGVYDLREGRFNHAELQGQGAGLDGCGERLEEIAREMNLCTAEDAGLAALEALLTYLPAAEDLESRRAALAALLRIGDESFTLTAINDSLVGCGVPVMAVETGTPNEVVIRFPGTAGEPVSYSQVQKIVEDILPCHVGITYRLAYATWETVSAVLTTWAVADEESLLWSDTANLV